MKQKSVGTQNQYSNNAIHDTDTSVEYIELDLYHEATCIHFFYHAPLQFKKRMQRSWP